MRPFVLTLVLVVPLHATARPDPVRALRAVRQAAGTEVLQAWTRLRHALARPRIDRALRSIPGAPAAKVLLVSDAERRLHGSLVREARLLRGARPNTLAHRRLQVVRRRLEVLRDKRRQTGRLPAWASAQTDGATVTLNVDRVSNPLTTLAHELRHVRDERRRPWDGSDAQRVGNERRAHRAEGLVLGLTGRPIRAQHYLSSKGEAQDRVYPPLKLATATVHGYLIGVRQALGPQLRSARPEARARVNAYLRAYREVLLGQAAWSVANPPREPPRDPLSQVTRWLSWQKLRAQRAIRTPLQKHRQRTEPVTGVEAARQAGQRDAWADLSPLTRARALLGQP